MTFSPEQLSDILHSRLDAICFSLLAILVAVGSWRFLRRRSAADFLGCGWWLGATALVLAGITAAEWASRSREESLAAELTSFVPTYTRELQRLNHAGISAATSPDDPTFAAIHGASQDWFRLNPELGELFTFRAADQQRVRVVVDAAKPSNGFQPSEASFQRALAGETFFDPAIRRDSRGAWVRAYAPIREGTGRIEAGLVLGYSAGDWLRHLILARALVFGCTAFVLGGLLALAVLVALTRLRNRQHHDIERELQNAKIAADEASRAKSDFLAVMSHEIRTPLNAVMGFANLLAESKLDDAQKGYVATITSEGARLGSLVNDLLDLSKIEEGRLVLERLPFAPSETAHEVLRLLSGRAMEKKLELRFEAQLAGPLLVAGDPLRFHQILVNLVDNAIKFTPRGSITVFLQWLPAENDPSHGLLAVRVRDTGIGIAEDKLDQIFQKFMQADTSMTRRYGGTGLGLAICQRLVGLMGSRITVESKPGQGSEFSFSIPVSTVALTPEPAAPEPERPATPTRPPRVLVVDDMETNRFLLEVFLRRNGFEPELSSGGEEAVQLAARQRFDAILMDLQMPDIDGYTATRRIRAAEPAGQHTVIIALTASIGKGIREKCLESGMDEHLTKPLDLKKFKQLLYKLIADGPASAK